MRHFVTLTDSRYLPQAVALYESLQRHSSEPFTLHILPLDMETWNALRALDLSHVELEPIESFVYEMQLAKARENRNHREWCWTLASQLCEYFLRMGLPSITYLDADCFFFSDPKAAFEEIGDRSIAIVPHRFIPSKKHLAVNGQFNVSWVTFVNNPVGRECAQTWAWQCRERCSETEGCGDQKYLDAWPTKYGSELCVFRNPGVGTAPWNLANYVVSEGPKVDAWDVVMYHFHETRFREDGSLYFTGYRLRSEDVDFIYSPYHDALREARGEHDMVGFYSRSGHRGPIGPSGVR